MIESNSLKLRLTTPGGSHELKLDLSESRLCYADRSYPIENGIPVLLDDDNEVKNIVAANWSESQPGALAFYNRSDDHDNYCRSELNVEMEHLKELLGTISIDGPVLEIGSGKGPLQGIGGSRYVALDYSFTALSSFIDPRYGRVCASASSLPFPSDYFSCIFSVAALEHVPEAADAFEEIHRTLKPGGAIFLMPAWHCEQYNCEGIPVRSYSELNMRQKLIKLLFPILRSLPYKAIKSVPWRVLRRISSGLIGKPTNLRFGRLKPDYETFWISDSDAASRIDIHEACIFFQSRGYEIKSPGSTSLSQVLARHVPLIAVKSSR